MPTGLRPLFGSTWFLAFVKGLLCMPFVLSGLSKLVDFPSAIAEQQHFNLPAPALLAGLVIATQLGGSAALFTRWDWLGALALAGFTVFATLIAHAYWTYPPDAQFEQKNAFFEHAAIVGGFLMVVWRRFTLSSERA